MRLKQTDLETMPVNDKMLLIEQLWDSMNDDDLELSPQQKQELDQRLHKIKEGSATFISWEEAKTQIRS